MATEGIYGSIVFGKARGRIQTFEDINRKYAGRYGEHQVHLRKPLLEYGGPALVEIDYRVNLDASWCGDPIPLLAEWHFYQENALAAPLVVGGKPMGPGLSLFVITEFGEHHKHWLHRGRLISVELGISFKEYLPFTEGLMSSLGIPGFGGFSF